MKILKLKFKNINSLSGESEINFTNPVFTNDGLFAITGKTGAGKSSILDAISLAFYGKTPRVVISGSENAVMTRGEKDCYAEIVFEVAGKIWKSSWKQERTRTGTLKPVNRIIADSNDKIIADQVRACDLKIIEIIGLTFEQFTKVIMLAQGSFAAFLQADKNDKGELLEQITGTEIYGEISKKVFERNRTEKEKSDKLLVELDAIKILTDEEIKILNDEIIVFVNDKNQVDENLQKIEISKKWLSDLESLQKQINEAKQKLPELAARNNTAKETFENSENALKIAKEELKNQEPVFKKVREIDIIISEKQNLLEPILKVISELVIVNDALSKTIEIHKVDLEKSEKYLLEKRDWATKNKKYEDLVSNYSAIKNEKQLLDISLTEIEKRNIEIADLQNNLDLIKSNSNNASNFFKGKVNSLTLKTNELENKKLELIQILGEKELSELQSEKESITNFGLQIKKLIEVEKAILANQKEIVDFDEKIKQFESFINELLEAIDTNKKTKTNLESQINLIDENIKLTKTIQSLDEHRANLKDGEECPLCGSFEHPFAKGNVPKIGEKEKESATLKKQFQKTDSTIQRDEIQLAKYVSDKANSIENKSRNETALKEHFENQKEISSEIKIIIPDFSIQKGEDKIEWLNEVLSQKRDELKDVSTVIEQVTNSEKNLVDIRDKEIPALQNEKQLAEKLKNETETAQKLAELALKTKQDSATISKEKYEKENAAFLNKLKNYSVENIEALKICLDEWNDNKKQIEEFTNQITTLNRNIALGDNELENKRKLFNDKEREKIIIETEKQKLSDERKAIFAEKSVEREENRLNKFLEETEAKRTLAEKEKNETYTEFEKNKVIVTEKEKEISVKQALEITEKSLEELELEFHEMKIKADTLSQKTGANNHALKANRENLKSFGYKLKEKEKQQTNCNKWGKLNELIGSADGKKYRNFAQALTFDHLISLSNKQLQKMSDRYLLKRTGDSSNPFELSVIDKFQNSETRTAQNLSGGEKFIVSLALALGLANMASKNMRIDTMFIDEGFGTLDADYLDVALSALSNLQSEGKIIGIISHLTELKERIATHIEVVPSGNGQSKIQIKS